MAVQSNVAVLGYVCNEGQSSVEVLLTSELLLYTFTQMHDRAVADSRPLASDEIKPGYTTAYVLLKQKGTRTTSL